MSIGKIGTSGNMEKQIVTPHILLGGLQLGGHDPNPTALVAVSYPSHKEAQAWSKYLLSIQNGAMPFESGPRVYAGDSIIRINISPKPMSNKGYLCQIMAKTNPEYITYSFYVASYVTEEHFNVFCDLYDISDHYVFTVAHQDNLLLDTINLIKYTVDRRGV